MTELPLSSKRLIRMASLCSFLHTHRAFTVLLLACALAMKALVPAGFMLGSSSHTVGIEICDGQDHHVSGQLVIGQSGKDRDSRGDHGKSDGVCPYGALSHAGFAGADPVQLALALAFILVLPLVAPIVLVPARKSYLQPPQRGPPANAGAT